MYYVIDKDTDRILSKTSSLAKAAKACMPKPGPRPDRIYKWSDQDQKVGSIFWEPVRQAGELILLPIL